MANEVKACDRCGSVVTVHKALDGAIFYIPVSDAYLPVLFGRVDVDRFMADRLRRAEKIIVDLRKQLSSFLKND